jgi:hypothetical protein
MKKNILNLVLLVLLISSCSKDDSPVKSEEINDEIKVDYLIDSEVYPEIEGFVVNNDNTAYIANNAGLAKLQKVDPNGKVTLLKTFTDIRFYYNKLTNNLKGEILLTTNSSVFGNKIYSFTKNDYDINTYYTMKPSVSTDQLPIINSICNNGDDSYIIFDSNTFTIKKIVPASNSEVILSGSGKNEIQDGIGLNASFNMVSQIITRNNIIYVIDKGVNYKNGNSIRKIEDTPNGWKVTTLISSFTNFDQIAMDNQNNLYVLVNWKGIFKLNLQNNEMTVYKDSEFKIGTDKIHTSINFKYLRFMAIKNDDLYLQQGKYFLKISNFRSKL